MITKEHPLILVFYLDKELMQEREIINAFAESVNDAIALREANAMAFFLPSNGSERVECINPVLATAEQKEKIDRLISEVSKSFDIGQGADEGVNEGVNEGVDDYEGSAVKPFKNDD